MQVLATALRNYQQLHDSVCIVYGISNHNFAVITFSVIIVIIFIIVIITTILITSIICVIITCLLLLL